jgi:MFS family permease
VVAEVLLSLTLGGLKAFVVLWLTEGLGKTMAFTSAMMAIVACGAIAGALLAGRLADRYGAARVMRISLVVFGAGLSLPAFSSSTVILGAALPIIALSGGAASVVPYTLLMRLMPPRSHGAVSGLFDLANGAGTLLGPAITGAAIDLFQPVFAGTHGLAGMWPVISVSALASAAVLRRMPAR